MSSYKIAYAYPLTTQSVTYTATAGVTANAVGSHIYRVRLIASSDCHIAFGGSPTATTGDMRLNANSAEEFMIKPGQKVSAVQNAAGGTLYVTEMTQ